jgi:hypothetical protein
VPHPEARRLPVREHALTNSAIYRRHGPLEGPPGRREVPRPAREAPPVFEGECDMRVPQVSERIKEAPAQALRGVFAGIGQLLLITDKIRNKVPAYSGPVRPRPPAPQERQTAADTTAAPREEAAAPAPAAPAPAAPAPAAPAPAAPVRAEPVRTEAVRTKPVAAKPVAAEAVLAEPVPAEPVAAKPVEAKPVEAKPVEAEAPKTAKPRDFDKTGNVRLINSEQAAAAARRPADSGLPLPNYGELSIASLRARLRNLDVAQLRQLTDYERAHEARADVIAMFERRIAKLEAGA